VLPRLRHRARDGLGGVAVWNALGVALLACGLAFSAAAAVVWRANARSQAERSFHTEAATVGSTVTTALQRMDDLTVAAATLLEADPELGNRELATWYRNMGGRSRYPGALGFGYVERVPAGELDRFARAVRADPVPGVAPVGRTLEIVPDGRRASYCLIRLAVPGAVARLVPGSGFDLCAVVPGGEGLLTPRINAVAAWMPQLGDILVVSAPVHAAATAGSSRQGRVLGWITAVFDVRSVLGGAVAVDRALEVSVWRQNTRAATSASATPAGVPTGRLTRVAKVGGASGKTFLKTSFTLDADGRWVVRISKPPRWGWLSPEGQAAAVLAGGAIVSLLVFVLVQVLARGRARALRMVADKTGELRRLALHDPLTGLPNRVLVLDRADRLLARARRGGRSPAALFVDLDDFKLVNDTHGHQAGDELLRRIADRLAGTIRAADTLGRLGGDEFVVLVDDGDEGAAEAAARRLLAALEQPFALDAAGGDDVVVTASIGIAVGDRPNGESLLRDADAALYAAKGAGKRGYSLFGAGGSGRSGPAPDGPVFHAGPGLTAP